MKANLSALLQAPRPAPAADFLGLAGKTSLLLLLFLAVLLPSALQARDRVMVGEDIYVAEGEVLDDVVCTGCSIRVYGKVKDAVAIGGNIEIHGEAHDVVAIAGRIDVRGKVDGDAVSVAGGLRVHPGAEIRGDAVGVMGGVDIPAGAVVGGEVVSVGQWGHVALSGLLVVLVLCLLAGLLFQPLLVLLCFVIMGERRIGMLADTARHRAGFSFLVGVGLVIASFVFSILAAFLPVPGAHFPFALALFVVLVVGYAGVSYWVGRGLLPSSSALAAALLGAVLVTIIQLIPIIGQIAFMVFSMIALGSAALSGFGTSIDWLVERTSPGPAVRNHS
jgi:hypothetical protein